MVRAEGRKKKEKVLYKLTHFGVFSLYALSFPLQRSLQLGVLALKESEINLEI